MDWRDWLVVALVVGVIAYVAYRVGEYRGGGAQARLVGNSLWHVWAFAWFMYEGAGEPYGHNESGVRRYAREQIEAEFGKRPAPPALKAQGGYWDLLPGYPPDRSR